MVRGVCRIIACLAATIAIATQAADTSAQLTNTAPPAPLLLSVPQESPGFWPMFRGAFSDQLNDEIGDRFHPLTMADSAIRLAGKDPGALGNQSASSARQAITSSLFGGIQTATIDLPIAIWLEERQEFLSDLLEDSLGNNGEESVSPLSGSYQRAERSWWQTVSGSDRLRYGIRPLRADPYAYVSCCIKDRDRVLLLANVRYHYVNFADHSFELALSVPLATGCSMDIGTSYRFGQHDDVSRIACKVSKEFKNGSLFHVGLEVQRHPALIAGITVPL